MQSTRSIIIMQGLNVLMLWNAICLQKKSMDSAKAALSNIYGALEIRLETLLNRTTKKQNGTWKRQTNMKKTCIDGVL